MINSLFIFAASLFMVIKGATMTTRYAARLAESFHLSKYTVGFIIVAIISILPETFIAINSAIKGIPAFGLGTLLGSNIADLSLVFAVVVFSARRKIVVESKILKNNIVYPLILLLPIVLGLNGHFSRMEGLALIIAGGVFYFLALKDGRDGKSTLTGHNGQVKSFFMLLFCMTVLLVGAHFVVASAVGLANYLGVNPILIGMLIVGLGTTMPELFFALHSVKKQDDSLAIGDILGTVLADATIVVGILALISPFTFPLQIIYITGVFMVVASFVLFYFMKTGETLTKKEAHALLLFWILFVLVEFLFSK